MEYMSKERYDELIAEIEYLNKVELPRVQDELSEARAKGDLSENFEYHAAKRLLRHTMSQIKFKTNILAHAAVLDPSQLDISTVGLLRTVRFTNVANGTTMSYTIVNPHESNLREGKISIKSPIAEALLGHSVGDIVEAHAPAGIIKLKIEEISL